MPFKSEAQRKFLWAEHPEIAQRWADEEKARGKKSKRLEKKSLDLSSLDPALVANGLLGIGDNIGFPTSNTARAGLVGAAGALSTPEGGDQALNGVATGVGSGVGLGLADVLHSVASSGRLGAKLQSVGSSGMAQPLLRAALSSGGVMLGRKIVNANAEGRKTAAELYKVAFNFGGVMSAMGTAGKWMGRAAKVVGTLPTGVGNALSAGVGAIGGGMEAAAQGHGMGGILAHGLAGATAGIPGGVGIAASALASPVMNKLVPPPAPPAPGQMVGG